MAPGQYVILSFADSAHGIEEKKLAHVFKPFFRQCAPGFPSFLFCRMFTVNQTRISILGETFMEENSDNCTTDTIPIPVLDVERKTVPIICPKCNAITGVVKWHVERNRRTSPVYMVCRRLVHLFSRGVVIGGMRESESRHLGEYFRCDHES